jgi:hypothetical protein
MYQLNTPPVDVASLKENRESRSEPLPQRSSVSTGAPKSHVVGVNHTQHQQQVRQLPSNAAPAWLKSLLAVQQGAAIVFCSVLGLSIVVYGYTARTQDTWKAQHKQLKRFQAQEHQQAVMSENLKQDLAQQAEQSTSGLVDPNPNRMVFIPSAPQRPMKVLANPAPPVSSKSKLPVGY